MPNNKEEILLLKVLLHFAFLLLFFFNTKFLVGDDIFCSLDNLKIGDVDNDK